MDWQEVLRRFVDLLEQWDQRNPNRWYAYYLASLQEQDIPELAALLQEAVLSYTACKPAKMPEASQAPQNMFFIDGEPFTEEP